MLKNLLLSILWTTIVSSVFGFIGLFWLTHGFFYYFSITFIIQFIIFYIVKIITISFAKYKLAKLRKEEIELLSQQSIETPCAYCKTNNIVPIFINEENSFQCTNCGQTNGVYIDIRTTQVTTPLYEKKVYERINEEAKRQIEEEQLQKEEKPNSRKL